jgi:hypothetical protein
LTLEQLQAEASRARSAIIIAQEATRPKNSKRTSAGKQKPFIEWCSQKHKMIHFLSDMKDRKKKNGRKPRAATANANHMLQSLT